MSKIDLHIHSCFSDDGEYTPQEIIRRCREQKMELVAVTDHNSVRGVRQAKEAAGHDLKVLSGVELDCIHEGRSLHLLGYSFDETRKEFEEVEQDIFRQEKHAAVKKIQLFKSGTGIPIDEAAVLAAANGGVVTGEMIAEFALALPDVCRYEMLRPYLPGGDKSDMPHVRFYWDFFSEGKIAYVPMDYLSLKDAVRLIHSAGGAAVLAHPGQNLAVGDKLLPGIIREGIDGIEVFSSYHDSDISSHYLRVAEQNNLFVTCGSDFHGKHKPQIQLGGHKAVWNDQRLISGLADRLLF